MSRYHSDLSIYRTSLNPETGKFRGRENLLWVWEWKLTDGTTGEQSKIQVSAERWSDLESELWRRAGEILPMLNVVLETRRSGSGMSEDMSYYEYSCEFMSLLMDNLGTISTL